MKSFYERAEELAHNCIRVKNNNVCETLAQEYNINLRAAHDRFKSLFHLPIRDYITYINTPSKEVLRDAIIRNNSQEDLLKDLNIHYSWIRGLYDKYFKVSTFSKAKQYLINEVDVIQYHPSLEDNLSILISQYLGDGSFEFYDNRASLKIEHCEKQFDYLKFKVNLLKTAFPTIPGLETIRKRVNGKYISYIWRSNNIRHRYMNIIKDTPKEELISRMTPFGWCLWYLDDGNLFISKKCNHLSIAVNNPILQETAVQELQTYGFSFQISKSQILLSNKLEIIKFINSFVKPFIHLIPECMKYKCIVKI